MRAPSFFIATILALAAASTGVFAPAANGVTTGTFTAITTPGGTSFTLRFNAPPTATTLTVSGQASLDVTSVDVDCLTVTDSARSFTRLATGVPVTGGSFSTVGSISNLVANCRLRAVPSGVDPNADYLGAYAGPILYMWEFLPVRDGSSTVGFQAATEDADGIALALDAASCGPTLIATIARPAMVLDGPQPGEVCTVELPRGNVTAGGTSTASSIVVNGHNAYLPGTVSTYLRSTLGLGVPPSALATSVSRQGNGDLTVTESAPLMRCSGGDAYPPTSGSCPTLVGTGVTFTRVSSLIRGAHQIRVRDTFAATDGHAHSVSLQYQSQSEAVGAGTPGFLFPGHTHFSTVAPDQVVTGLGTKAATMLMRSDIHSVDGEQSADTRALTWSRAPSKLQFSDQAPTGPFAMPYTLSVPAGGRAYLGFALSAENRTAQVLPLAALAAGEMMGTPTITAPANGATLHGHRITVKGAVARGANGLPTSVSVNGHLARLTTVSADRATYQVTLSLAYGMHRITATATDIANNRRTRSVTIRNTA